MTEPAVTGPALVPELTVSDIEASLAFYVEALGFTVAYDRREEGFAMLEREGARLMLDRHGPRSWDTGPLTHPYGRGVNFEIGVSDVAAVRARIENSVFLEMETRTYRTGHSAVTVRQFCVQDPDGYLLRFQQVVADG